MKGVIVERAGKCTSHALLQLLESPRVKTDFFLEDAGAKI